MVLYFWWFALYCHICLAGARGFTFCGFTLLPYLARARGFTFCGFTFGGLLILFDAILSFSVSVCFQLCEQCEF